MDSETSQKPDSNNGYSLLLAYIERYIMQNNVINDYLCVFMKYSG